MSDTAVSVHDYFDDATFARIKAFADTHETPFLVVDTATIDRQYDDLRRYFPTARIYYAVKANPAPQVLVVHRQRPGLASPQTPKPGTVEVTCGRAERARPATIWSAVSAGLSDSIRLTAPATTGAEKLVPKW